MTDDGTAEPDTDVWIRETLPDAVAYATALLGDHALAEDVVQDCYVRLLRKRGAYNLRRDGRKLLFRSITNASINATRSSRVRRAEPTLAEIEDVRTPSPSEVLAARELAASMTLALDQLPMRERAALELAVAGETAAVIAEVLGIKASHVSVLVHRARARLKESIRTMTDTLL